jgi:hypothetical protein
MVFKGEACSQLKGFCGAILLIQVVLIRFRKGSILFEKSLCFKPASIAFCEMLMPFNNDYQSIVRDC